MHKAVAHEEGVDFIVVLAENAELFLIENVIFGRIAQMAIVSNPEVLRVDFLDLKHVIKLKICEGLLIKI